MYEIGDSLIHNSINLSFYMASNELSYNPSFLFIVDDLQIKLDAILFALSL